MPGRRSHQFWMPLRSIGNFMRSASQGRMFYQVKMGEAPRNCELLIPRELALLAEPEATAGVLEGGLTLVDLSSPFRSPGTGVASVRQTNITFGMAFIRASLSSLLLRSFR